MHELCVAALAGQAREAAAIQWRLLALHKALFCEPSPAPTKWAMSRLGRCGTGLRLPITPLTAAGQAQVQAALQDAGLL
jgi:4-hydroxy-tetrahydrodipicolinate synthase